MADSFWTPFCSLDGFICCHGSASAPNDGSLAVIVHVGISTVIRPGLFLIIVPLYILCLSSLRHFYGFSLYRWF